MKRRCLSLLCCALLVAGLSGCKKFEDNADVDAPEPLPGKEAEWREYGEMPDFTFLADVKSISREDAYVNDDYLYVWVKQLYKADQQFVVSDKADPAEGAAVKEKRKTGQTKYTYRIRYARMALNCKAGTMAGTAVALHDANDEEEERWDTPGYAWEFEAPPAGTYGEDFIRQVCSLGAKTDKK